MTMITPSYLGETIEYSSLHACRSTLEDPTFGACAELKVRHLLLRRSSFAEFILSEVEGLRTALRQARDSSE